MASGIASLSSITGSSTATKTDANTIAGNFTQFLTLLTTQLKNQNPLDPMDTNQFTQQLVQFAGVEQQLKTNDRLDSILSSAKATAISQASDFVGQTVTSDGKSATLKNGEAQWTLTPARPAKAAIVTITDSKGNVVVTKNTPLAAGAQSFVWNGRNAAGLNQPDGLYSVTVNAIDVTGAQVNVDTQVTGRVDSVDLDGSEPILVIGKSRVPVSSVKSLGSSGA